MEHHRTVHKAAPATTPEQKLQRLICWKHWRKAGYTGDLLRKRTKLQPCVARKWAVELKFDLEGTN